VPVIACRLLGPVELSVDGEAPPAELLWKKNLALLAYLALSPRYTRSREHLVGLLWGDKPESAARHSLNEALRVLRRAVGEDALHTDATTVRLEPEAVETDLAAFTRHEAAGEWEAAAGLVGGALLDGFAVPGESAFEDWLTAERVPWERRSVTALVRAAELDLAKGRTQQALALAERAAVLAPTSSQAAGALIRSLALSGDRAGALRRFEEHARLLREQLDTAPDAEVAAIAGRIRKERVGPTPGSDEARVALTRRLPLIGREGPLAELTDAWRRCLATRHATVMVVLADAGFGKTRLAEELVARAALDGAATLTVRGVEADHLSPWSGLLGLARGGLLGTTGIAGAPAAAHAALAAQIPEWGDHFRGVAGAEPTPLPRAFSELIRAASDEQPVLIVADDSHLLDPESLAAVVSLPRDLPAAPILLLLTAELAAPSPGLDALRSRLGRDIPGGALTLGPLEHDHLAAMARAVFPHYDDDAVERLTRRVAADSAGVPLLAIEILHAVSAGLDLRQNEGAWPAPYHTLTQTTPGELPDTVVAAIRIGYRRLSAGAQQVLAAAAVLGGRVTAPRLVRATSLATPEVNNALDELEWQRWLVADGRGYVFVAGIVERVIDRDMLTPGQRRRIQDAVKDSPGPPAAG
jgi:DNA-binding SARP family transcriptional activator